MWPFFILEPGDDLADRDERIGRCAAINAGVQIGPGAAHFELGVDHAAQAHTKRGQPRRKELGVRDERKVGLEVGGLGGDVRFDRLASYFLFALEEDAHIEWQRAVGCQQRFQCLNLGHHLAFVVDRAARVDVAIALRGLEGRRKPLVERVGRLHIVVAVNEHGGLAPHGRRPVRGTPGFPAACSQSA